MSEEKFIIKRAKEPKLISECALLMFHSEPWLTLGMQYAYCLKAFEGDYREVICDGSRA